MQQMGPLCLPKVRVSYNVRDEGMKISFVEMKDMKLQLATYPVMQAKGKKCPDLALIFGAS